MSRGVARLRTVPWRGLLTLGLLLSLSGCRGCPKSNPPIHLNPNMDNQPKYRAQSVSEFFADGATMRTPVEGTVARGALPVADAFETGRVGEGFVGGIPTPVDAALLARGAERFAIYCAPCHGDSGNGRGALFQRSQIESANMADPRLIDMPSGEIFDTISNGLGLMPAYDYVIPVADRWAIVAHVRTLQGSDATTMSVPNEPTAAVDGGLPVEAEAVSGEGDEGVTG